MSCLYADHKQQTLPKQGLYADRAEALAIASLAAIIAVAVVISLPAMVTFTPIPAITMPLLVTRNIFAVIPAVFHKVDPFAAGIVFVAVLAPVLGVARRYAQIDRWAAHRHPLDDSRLTIDHLWRRIAADIEPAIEAGFADTDRDANVGSKGGGGDDGNGHYCCGDQQTFHIEHPVVGLLTFTGSIRLALLIAIPAPLLPLPPLLLAFVVPVLLFFLALLRSLHLLPALFQFLLLLLPLHTLRSFLTPLLLWL